MEFRLGNYNNSSIIDNIRTERVMEMEGNERFMATIKGEESDRIPVFPLLMSFSARRYGVTYREFASNHHILAESQLNISEMFDIDAITACPDAFRVSADLGGDIVFPEEKPPYLAQPLVKSEEDIKRLKKPDVLDPKGRMADRIASVGEMVRSNSKQCMVLGWVDMPFAEACSVCGVAEFMTLLYDNPGAAHKLLEFITNIVIEFALAQVEVGAPTIGAGDAAASLISPSFYREFALPYEQRVCQAIHNAGGYVKLHICGNTTQILDDMINSGADLFNIDHMVDLSEALKKYDKASKASKGNIDPTSDMLYTTPEKCYEKAKNCIKQAQGKKYMLSPGCEVPAEVSDDVFSAFCSAVK
jgi:uroporphyrinogen decarboxylase